MENIFDRLQFIRHEEIFPTREDAYTYVINHQIRGDYPTITDPSKNMPALFGEPMVLLYESKKPHGGPNVILAIGSVGNGTASNDNKTFFIDTQRTEEEIEEINIKIDELYDLFNIIAVESPTLKLNAEQSDEGTIISGDVKIADYKIVSGNAYNNIITTEKNKGIYAFVDMDYDPETFVITFNVNGITKDFQLPEDKHVTRGWYDINKEAIVLKLADDSKVEVEVDKLIDEWTVLSSASTTPIMLFKEHVSSSTEHHSGIYDWQDLLEADVRVADHIEDNIIHKDATGRYLYVKGTADNIKYKNGLTVADALDNVDMKVSTSAGNMIYRRPDGLFASAMLDYNTAENKLIYRYTDTQTQDFKEVSFKLNSIKLLDDITYDPVKEVIVIRYIDTQGEYQTVEIPAKDIIEEWVVNNEAHNIELVKYRSEGQGQDILSADAKIHAGDNNILEDRDHKLYVNGISDNIKYDVTGETTVKDVLDGISGETVEINAKLDAEIERAKAAEKVVDDKIGTGFTDDPHENVTAKFDGLNQKVDDEISRSTEKDDELESAIAAETSRATSAETVLDGKIEAIEDEIGDGFGPRNTVRHEIDNLQSEIEAVSADSLSSIKDIINVDHSINVDKTNPTSPILNVNLSTEIEDGRRNIIKLNNDGLFANVDLDYISGENKLIFHKTDGTPDKEIQLESMSSIISIEYNPTKEAIVITYMTNGHEVKVVEIPVGDLINEWRVEDGHPHAVQLEKVRVASGTSEQDVLKASVIITDSHNDNILVMDDGALYVSGTQISANTAAIEAEVQRAQSAETALQTAINDEETRAEAAEQALSGAIDNEVERATTIEDALLTSIETEVERAEAAEQALQTAINNEVVRATSAETALQTAINTETARATSAETRIEHLIQDEIANEVSRAQNSENSLSASISSEISRSTAEDERLENAISSETAAREAADIALRNAIDSVELEFGDTTSIDFTKSNENVVTADVKIQGGDNIIKLGQGLYATATLEYDQGTNRLRLVTSNGAQEYINLVGATLLDSIVYDSENKVLTINYTDGTGSHREVSVGITDLWNEWRVDNPAVDSAIELTKTIGDPGNPDILSGRVLIASSLPDNGLKIVGNGLYVSTSGATKTSGDVECLTNEVKAVETAIFGLPVESECGLGFTYTPITGSTIISGATSFYDADSLLSDAIVSIPVIVSGETCTATAELENEGTSKKMQVNVKLSHGKNGTDNDLVITSESDSRFTESNALSSICIDNGGIKNGVFLSTTWDCGSYDDYGITVVPDYGN